MNKGMCESGILQWVGKYLTRYFKQFSIIINTLLFCMWVGHRPEEVWQGYSAVHGYRVRNYVCYCCGKEAVVAW